MNKQTLRFLASITCSLSLTVSIFFLAGAQASAQCPLPQLTSGLQIPLGLTQTDRGNLLVSESGIFAPNTGRISIVDLHGQRRTLLAGLPSGINDVNEPAGPAGLFLRGRTLYVAIGIGDSILAGPFPGSATGNPNPSSPLFSSILAIELSEGVERFTSGFNLTAADQQALASGERVRLSNGGSDTITIELVANFPNFTPNPLPTLATNVRGSNPFDLVLVTNRNRDDDHRSRDDGDDDGDRCESELLYVTDGGQNLVWRVDIRSGGFSMLAVFPPIPNPMFPAVGGPFMDAVPTGIAYSDGQLLVTLFRGVPFAPGTSVVQRVDPLTGNNSPFITGLKTAIDVLQLRRHHDTDYLVLQHSSAPGPFFGTPGRLVRFETPTDPPAVLADCLVRPTAMTLDERSGRLYITEVAGRIVSLPIAP